MRARFGLAGLALVAASCVGGGSGDVVAAPSSSSSTTKTTDDQRRVEPEADVFRIAPAGAALPLVIRYGPDGVLHPTRHNGFTKVVEGPVSAARDAFLTGVVYQRPGDTRRIFGQRDENELVVAAENETIDLVGIRNEPTDGNISHVLYLSRTSSTPEATTETLRSYNRQTGEDTEIYETGGWESGTDFSYTQGEWAVGRWSGEGYTRFDIVNVVSGEIRQSFPAEGECFEGERAEGCLPFIVATLAGQKMYGFGPSQSDAGVNDSLTLYELNPQTTQPIPLASFPWTDGLYYPIDIWAIGSVVVVLLSTAPHADEGQPLPALIYNTETGEAWTAPEAEYLHRAFFN